MMLAVFAMVEVKQQTQLAMMHSLQEAELVTMETALQVMIGIAATIRRRVITELVTHFLNRCVTEARVMKTTT